MKKKERIENFNRVNKNDRCYIDLSVLNTKIQPTRLDAVQVFFIKDYIKSSIKEISKDNSETNFLSFKNGILKMQRIVKLFPNTSLPLSDQEIAIVISRLLYLYGK